jgi:exopolyphosphatase/guanosine-5'-triphosphate,3'-diphosphate pyrophosphatase
MIEKNQNLAAIDVGTNSFHLIIVKILEDGNFEVIDREKEVIRLGEGSGTDIKYIKPDAFKRGLAALKRFKGIADSHNASIKAVATSAVREAHNKIDFLNAVFEKTKINVEVISGYEEARLIYLGALRAVPIYNKKILLIDIGGGSTEFLIGKRNNIFYSISVKIGAVRLTQKFFPNYRITEKGIKECRKWVEGEIYQIAESAKRIGFDKCLGSAGTIMSAGFMIQAKNKGTSNLSSILNNFEFTKSELAELEKDILKWKTVQQRKKIEGIDEKRAEIIPAGIIILKTIFDLFGLERLTISGNALREGIIIDTLQKLYPQTYKSNFNEIKQNSVKQLAEKCKYDKVHCEHIAKLAVKLFDDLAPLHNLNSECKEYLEAAAILHDVGYHISHTNHHIHSYYIIKNSELLGFNDNEINIIAHTARYHRKSLPKKSHSDFEDLPKTIKDIALKLSAILRVADSFDRTHKQIIKNINSRIAGKTVFLNLECDDNINPEVEIWNFNRRKTLFEEVYGKKIVCRT